MSIPIRIANKLNFFAYLLVICIPYVAESRSFTCPDALSFPVRTTQYWGQSITYREVNVDHSWSRPILPNDVIPDLKSSDLFVGFTNDHVYLVYNGLRYDPGLAFTKPSKVREISSFSPGTLLRIKDVPSDVGNRLIQNLVALEQERALSCVSGVCQVLEKSGFFVRGMNQFPTSLLRNIFQRGFVTDGGITLRAEMYLINSPEFAEQMRLTHRGELGLAKTFLIPIIALVGTAGAIGIATSCMF